MWHGDINVLIIKGKYDAQCDVCYCTSWSGPNKLGRPSKKDGKRKHGVMDHIEKVGMKKKRKKQMCCKICQKFNHITKECYKNNLNQDLPVADVNNNLLGAGIADDARDSQIGKI